MKLTFQQFKKYIKDAQDKFEYKRIQAVFLRIIQKKHAKEVSIAVSSPQKSLINGHICTINLELMDF